LHIVEKLPILFAISNLIFDYLVYLDYNSITIFGVILSIGLYLIPRDTFFSLFMPIKKPKKKFRNKDEPFETIQDNIMLSYKSANPITHNKDEKLKLFKLYIYLKLISIYI